jgi:4-hydroxy 2-oxovalerate aldolase
MIKILDCTLRDGGYVNDWNFEKNNINFILNGLCESNVDIVEYGFLTTKKTNENKTLFNNLNDLNNLIFKKNVLPVIMINYGDFNCENLPKQNETKIKGIRLAFHKNNIKEALECCKIIKSKGYLLFIQPMVTITYSDAEFIDLIKLANDLNPFAFYIVDSFGEMKQKDLLRFFYLIENNLNKDVNIGFHSHNNLQLSFSNSQVFSTVKTERNLICDSSIFGMGRGAGNLNTELFMKYLNEINDNNKYNINPIIKIIDEVLFDMFQINPWGYSLAQFLSATNRCHPNYATFLTDKKTLNFEDISNIIKQIPQENKNDFNVDLINKIYIKYQSKNNVNENFENIKNIINKDILLVFPGSSIDSKINEINNCEKYFKIGVNFYNEKINMDVVFVSNKRRFNEIQQLNRDIEIISTSNISKKNKYIVSYTNLLNSNEFVFDNSGLMCIKMILNLGFKRIFIAGFDGYSFDFSDFSFNNSNHKSQIINENINKVLEEYSKQIEINFITEKKFIGVK